MVKTKKNKNRKIKNCSKKKTHKQKAGMFRILGFEPSFTPNTYEELKEAVNYYCDNNRMFYKAGILKYGAIGTWNVSRITNMDSLFLNKDTFNEDINDWNVSNVTNMHSMFNGAISFNQPLNEWNTSNVTDMSKMFWGANVFNQPLDNWNTSNVTDMRFMFLGAESFNQNITNWNTQNIMPDGFDRMFEHAYAYNYPEFPDMYADEILPDMNDDEILPDGRAYQVHNAFDAINFDLLFETIKVNKTISSNITPKNIYNFFNKNLNDNDIFKQNDKETMYLKNNLQAIHNKIISIDLTGDIGTISKNKYIKNIFLFVNAQPNEFIHNYVYSYIKDNIGAYGDDYDDNSTQPNLTTSSCVKGMFERIILNLRSGGMGLNDPTYIKIAKIIGNETIVGDDCETHAIMIADSIIAHFVSMCLNNENNKKELLSQDMNKRSDFLALCVLRKLASEGHLIGPVPDNDALEYYDQSLLERIKNYLSDEGVREMYQDDYLTGGRIKSIQKNVRIKRNLLAKTYKNARK